MVEGIRSEVATFKLKEFRYENSNITNLKREIGTLRISIGEM
jgi:hypothetical protein